MALRDDILRVLRENPAGETDGDLARRLGNYHAHVYQTCVRLAADGLIERNTNRRPILNRISDAGRVASVRPVLRPVATAPATPAREEWFWEGNIQALLVTYLAREGWQILRASDTGTRERGTDVIARRGAERLFLEVKGWPSTQYADVTRATEAKRTLSTVQAGTYFGGALLSALQLRDAEPDALVALGFPDMPRYRSLFERVRRSLTSLHVSVLFVSEDGSVSDATSDADPDSR